MFSDTGRRALPGSAASRILVAVAVTLLLAASVAACGTSSSSSGASGSSKAHLKVAWLFYGPYNDGGWNVSHRAAQVAVQRDLGSSIQTLQTDNIPFTPDATNVSQRFIAEGANVLIDTAAYGDLFTKVCKQDPAIKCFENAPVGTQPPNTAGFYTEHWVPGYAAGVTAGLLTRTGTVGFVYPFNLPLVNVALNSFAMGCRSVKPNCIVRVININNYFDPPAEARAANSLVNAGADVLRGFPDDPTYCRVAEQRGVFAIPEYSDGSSTCPNWVATSTIWHWTSFYETELRSILAGNYHPQSLTLIPAKTAFSLGPWGPKVPAAVRQKVETVFAQLQNGTLNPFVGPIYDSKGHLRVPAGTKLTSQFLYGGWTWYVKGVVVG